MRIFNYSLIILFLILFISCEQGSKDKTEDMTPPKLKLMTLDPGHFHAALVQKKMYDNVDSVVFVYAPEGNDLEFHINRIRGFNTRKIDPTYWVEEVYMGQDFFEKMLKERPGNVLVLSGNNAKKDDYIIRTINLGINILADKPMIISPDDFPTLVQAFQSAAENNVLLYDIMTERFEITTLLQKELSQIPEVFGSLLAGSPEQPAITKESVHHFFKYVSGKALIRPAWFFDVEQQGEGIVDVTTHLVDLVQWECFPEQVIDYQQDIELANARRWTTDLSPQQFKRVTGLNEYPDYLQKDLDGEILKVYSNGDIVYKIKDVFAKVSVIWKYQAPEGTGDTHYSIMRGSGCDLIIRQGEEEGYKPILYVASKGDTAAFGNALKKVVGTDLQKKYPGIELEKLSDSEWRVNIPDEYKVGHEAHFSQVTEKFLEYLENDNMPAWEVPNMLAKYYTTTAALKMAKSE
jgi:predicted dehydrogenase